MIDSQETLLEELHGGRFEAVHRTPSGRLVRFEVGSLDGALAEGTPDAETRVSA